MRSAAAATLRTSDIVRGHSEAFCLPIRELNLHSRNVVSRPSLSYQVLHVLLVVADVFDQLRVGE